MPCPYYEQEGRRGRGTACRAPFFLKPEMHLYSVDILTHLRPTCYYGGGLPRIDETQDVLYPRFVLYQLILMALP